MHCDTEHRALPPRVLGIIREVADRHGVTAADIVGPSKRRRHSYARFEAAAELRKPHMGRRASTPIIGGWLGGRDHTTILAALRRFAERKDAS